MNTKEAKQSVQMDKALFDFYGKPSIGQSLPLAIQHVLAMIVGCVTPSIIVAGLKVRSRSFTGRFCDSYSGSACDVCIDDIDSVISVY